MDANGGTLHVVATPIGNLGDLSPRAREVLAKCALVLCEDTRRTGKLMEAMGVEARLRTCNEQDEARRIPDVIERLRRGEDVALVTDAGTPGVSDPGYRLVRAVAAEGLHVSPVPGPSAVLAALSVSGLPTSAFAYEGFLPRRSAARRRLLVALADEPRTLVFLEAPHRLPGALADLCEVLGPLRPACLCRELTKLHEEVVRGTLLDLCQRYPEESEVLGEVTLVVGGAQRAAEAADASRVREAVDALVREGLDERAALKRVARELGLGRRDVYRLVKIDEEE
jgi:16S rRNA (cytidine1402-2'-O)-methyltransferase